MKHHKTQVILNPSCIFSHLLLTVLLAGSSTCPAKPTLQVFSVKSLNTSVKGYLNRDTGLHIPRLWIPHLPAGVILSSLINISNSACILHNLLASTSLCTLYKTLEGNKCVSCLLRRWELSSSSHTADRSPSCCRTHLVAQPKGSRDSAASPIALHKAHTHTLQTREYGSSRWQYTAGSGLLKLFAWLAIHSCPCLKVHPEAKRIH